MRARLKGKNLKKPENKSVQLHIGQMIKLEETDRNGDRKKKTIQIKKFYRNHVLCRVNGKYNESFSYEELLRNSGVQND